MSSSHSPFLWIEGKGTESEGNWCLSTKADYVYCMRLSITVPELWKWKISPLCISVTKSPLEKRFILWLSKRSWQHVKLSNCSNISGALLLCWSKNTHLQATIWQHSNLHFIWLYFSLQHFVFQVFHQKGPKLPMQILPSPPRKDILLNSEDKFSRFWGGGGGGLWSQRDWSLTAWPNPCDIAPINLQPSLTQKRRKDLRPKGKKPWPPVRRDRLQ